ncbi:MAG: GDP-mannose dehydrogenase [Thermoprotei archaeon]|nr:MAG: GDP-mannose dehydrogenase [Thermoprotei archaeon]
MELRSVLVLGLGEVGRAMYEIISESNKYNTYGYDTDPSRTIHKLDEIPVPIDIIHICYPYRDEESFISISTNYIKRFRPRLVIIDSTVAVGTTETLYRKTNTLIVHSPIRGKHPYLKEHIRFWTKYIGPINNEAGKLAKEYFESLGLKVKVLSSPRETELGKLLETTYRALLIAWWQEMHRIAHYLGVNFLEAIDIVIDTHKVLRDRPIYYPDYIGGHCLIPNAKILLKKYRSKFIEAILESNEYRKEEKQKENILREIEIMKRIAEEFINKDYYRSFSKNR